MENQEKQHDHNHDHNHDHENSGQMENSSSQSMDTHMKDHNSGGMPMMASFWNRLGAVIVDGIIIWIAGFIATLPFSFFFSTTRSLDSVSASAGAQSTSTLIYIVVMFLYVGYFYTTTGQTPGKKLFKVKVVKSDGLGLLNWYQVFLRDIVGKFVSGFFLDLGYLWYYMSEKRQTWHDSIASTYAVKVDDSGQIMMGGPSSYKKEPVKTFGICGCFGLVIIVTVIASFSLIAAIIGGGTDTIRNLDKNGVNINSNTEGDNMNFQFQGEDGKQFNMKVNPETGEFMMQGDDFNMQGNTKTN